MYCLPWNVRTTLIGVALILTIAVSLATICPCYGKIPKFETTVHCGGVQCPGKPRQVQCDTWSWAHCASRKDLTQPTVLNFVKISHNWWYIGHIHDIHSWNRLYVLYILILLRGPRRLENKTPDTIARTLCCLHCKQTLPSLNLSYFQTFPNPRILMYVVQYLIHLRFFPQILCYVGFQSNSRVNFHYFGSFWAMSVSK